MSSYQLLRVVVAAVIHDRHGRFLLGKRADTKQNLPGYWATPAGHVEINEPGFDTLETNLKRELKEETGVDIVVEQYLDSHCSVDGDIKKVTIVFLCTVASGEAQPLLETAAVAWYTPEELRAINIAPQVLRLITKATMFLARTTYDL